MGAAERMKMNTAFTGIFAEYDRIMDSYIADYTSSGKADVPYFYYNERANVSVFAGAVWRANEDNLALEEYSTKKVSTSSEDSGRRDLWFRSSGFQFRAEAKQQWCLLGRVTGKLVHEWFDTVAEGERRKIEDEFVNETSYAMGIVFVTWWLEAHQKDQFHDFNEVRRRLMAEKAATDPEHFLHHSYMRPDPVESTKTGTIYPGVDLIIAVGNE